MQTEITLGIHSFGEVTRDPHTGTPADARVRVRELVERAVLADEVGVDLFGLGEHHRDDFASSSPLTILAAIAARTSRIRLTTAISVLAADDPVRVFEQLTTIDAISEGRAQLMVGRGAYREAFELFGHDDADYGALFREKLELLLQLRGGGPIRWSGRSRPRLTGQTLTPPPTQEPIPVWVAGAGSVSTARLAGERGLGLTLALFGEDVSAYRPVVDAYLQAGADAGFSREQLNVGTSSLSFIGATDAQARDDYYPYYSEAHAQNFMTRDSGRGVPRSAFDAETGPLGSILVGSSDTVAAKILRYRDVLDVDTVLLQIGFGGMPHPQMLSAIERLGREVRPVV